MSPSRRIQGLKNIIDFNLRGLLTWSPRVSRPDDRDLRLAREVGEFLRRFPWKAALARLSAVERVRVADVGAKNFFLARELQSLFAESGREVEIHGFEIDAHRRYKNLRTRQAYGDYYASQLPHARFHSSDFLNWREPLDVIILLNPFVWIEQHLAWGLPADCFQPERLFSHARQLMGASGVLLVSSPDEEELDEAARLATNARFKSGESAKWTPTPQSLQQQPRWGRLFYS